MQGRRTVCFGTWRIPGVYLYMWESGSGLGDDLAGAEVALRCSCHLELVVQVRPHAFAGVEDVLADLHNQVVRESLQCLLGNNNNQNC